MDRRSFIRGLAAALPAGAVAAQVTSETDPIKAAFLALRSIVEHDAPERMMVSSDMFSTEQELLAHALPPNFSHGDTYAQYKISSGCVLKS